jgi:hypothetical protein
MKINYGEKILTGLKKNIGRWADDAKFESENT